MIKNILHITHYGVLFLFCFAKIKTNEKKAATFSIQNIAKTYTAGNAISISLRQNRKLLPICICFIPIQK
jgi:hypothetical protein